MRISLFLICLQILAVGEAHADELPLQEDISRSELAVYAADLDSGPKTFSYRFRFPTDASAEHVWGIDVSHYSGAVDWDKMVDQNVTFAFAKATQGTRYYDSTFATNWNALARQQAQGVPIYRGAYHFLSAAGTGEDQADNFLKVVGKIEKWDLPPCLDLEWDFEISGGRVVTGSDGKPIDRWAAVPASDIVAAAKGWLERVKERTGKTPVIYTNRHWWVARIGSDQSLAGYPLWIADYGSRSLNKESPSLPEGHQWDFWQLTDKGKILGGAMAGNVDTNVFVGTVADFRSRFGSPVK
ncbi:GH25 family lysozyme [Mesorhizobium sp. LNJC391B00]|uniref:glycoside hydrolase family 25 protein n=1 Tax=Mesorhizobium sp. LNJC391B00 TaxID=1287273 RepID=UPI0003CF8B72|nr:GH25 family lysozyme [Mesorhizobium sp. LNJC391B00]ESY27448.1 hydrolase [Mesorhizobium sp. LNJC391B00]